MDVEFVHVSVGADEIYVLAAIASPVTVQRAAGSRWDSVRQGDDELIPGRQRVTRQGGQRDHVVYDLALSTLHGPVVDHAIELSWLAVRVEIDEVLLRRVVVACGGVRSELEAEAVAACNVLENIYRD